MHLASSWKSPRHLPHPKTGRSEPVPRHREINEILARRIVHRLTGASEE